MQLSQWLPMSVEPGRIVQVAVTVAVGVLWGVMDGGMVGRAQAGRGVLATLKLEQWLISVYPTVTRHQLLPGGKGPLHQYSVRCVAPGGMRQLKQYSMTRGGQRPCSCEH